MRIRCGRGKRSNCVFAGWWWVLYGACYCWLMVGVGWCWFVLVGAGRLVLVGVHCACWC